MKYHPSKITMSGQKHVANDYAPDGRKLSSQHVAFMPVGNGASRRTAVTDLYVDGLVLRGGKPLMWRLSAKGQGRQGCTGQLLQIYPDIR